MTRRDRLRFGAGVMWICVILFGIPAVVLAWVNDRSRLPLALMVVGVGGVSAVIATFALIRRQQR